MMSYKLVTDHWIVAVEGRGSHGEPGYLDYRYCWSEEEMKNTLEEAMGSYYETVKEVSEVKVIKYDLEQDVTK